MVFENKRFNICVFQDLYQQSEYPPTVAIQLTCTFP